MQTKLLDGSPPNSAAKTLKIVDEKHEVSRGDGIGTTHVTAMMLPIVSKRQTNKASKSKMRLPSGMVRHNPGSTVCRGTST